MNFDNVEHDQYPIGLFWNNFKYMYYFLAADIFRLIQLQSVISPRKIIKNKVRHYQYPHLFPIYPASPRKMIKNKVSYYQNPHLFPILILSINLWKLMINRFEDLLQPSTVVGWMEG